jgi:hypothetical protein
MRILIVGGSGFIGSRITTSDAGPVLFVRRARGPLGAADAGQMGGRLSNLTRLRTGTGTGSVLAHSLVGQLAAHLLGLVQG